MIVVVAVFTLLALGLLPVDGVYPDINPQESLTAYRGRLRQAAPPATSFSSSETSANGFTYTLGNKGQVQRVVGFVSTAATATPFGDHAPALFDRYCDNLVSVTDAPLTHPGRVRQCGKSTDPQYSLQLGQQLDKGHIIAQNLGGSNRDLINLMPQNAVSNQRGRWKKIEQVLEFAMKAKPAQCNGRIQVTVTLIYATATDVTPNGGQYVARIPSDCWDEIIDLAANPGSACYKNALDMTPASNHNKGQTHSAKPVCLFRPGRQFADHCSFAHLYVIS